MIPLLKAVEHEVNQFKEFLIWIGCWSLMWIRVDNRPLIFRNKDFLPVMFPRPWFIKPAPTDVPLLALLFPEVSLDFLWDLVILFAFVRAIYLDWARIYYFDKERPSLAVNVVRLVVNSGIHFGILLLFRENCHLTDVAMIEINDLTLFGTSVGTVNCGCWTKFCMEIVAVLSSVMAVCNLRLQISAFSVVLSICQLLGAHFLGKT